MEHHLNIACAAARAASDRLLSLWGHAKVSQKEGSQNLVTQADIESEEIITEIIGREFPDHKFLREEGESTGRGDDACLWVIDPLDATNNYAHGIPHFCVSIAYAEKGVVRAGVVLDPLRNECFTAIRGKGSLLNGEQINVSQASALSECIVGTGFYYDRGRMMKRTLEAIGHLFSLNIRGMRRMGSAAIDLCWVACGRFDAFFEYRLAPWDYSAGSLIIHEAGGKCADRAGNPLQLASESVLASNSRIFDDFVEAVQWSD